MHPIPVEHLASAWPAIPPPADIPLTVLPEHECSYLPARMAQTRGFICDRIPAELYHELMNAGFRRSGRFIYQPICAGCRECRPIRLAVDRFEPSKSQRRAWRRNHDLLVTVGEPEATQEKFDLYARYLSEWHHRDEDATPEAFVSFLYDSPVQTLEIAYRDATGRLVGVGLCDLCAPMSLSSVYFYFDPRELRRGLGTFSTLWEINFAREHKISHYYLGYWISGSDTMQYKSSFRPHELLDPDGVWRAQVP